MGCKDCELLNEGGGGIAFYRIGNPEIGWGNVGITGCRKHVKLAIDTLNYYHEQKKLLPDVDD